MDLFAKLSGDSGAMLWEIMASPKPSSEDRSKLKPWVVPYASFSQKFADQAVELITSGKRGSLVDPFVGLGTTLAACARHGIKATGIDLDPFSAIVSKMRVASEPNLKKIQKFQKLVIKKGGGSKGSHSKLFTSLDISFAETVILQLEEDSRLKRDELFKKCLKSQSAEFDTEVSIFAALMIAANQVAKIQRGSNPVWLRQVDANPLNEGKTLQKSFREALVFVGGLTSLNSQDFQKKKNIRVVNDDFLRHPIKEKAYDYFFTSPPYLNRLDYVVKHLPAIEIANMIVDSESEKLRRKMIGTTKILKAGFDNIEIGRVAERYLSKISKHDSVASSTYYYKNYRQYFIAMSRVLRKLFSSTSDKATGVIVIQESFYKEIRIPTGEIINDMARVHGFNPTVVRSETVRSHMGRMSPQQRKYVTSKELREQVLLLSKA